MASMKQRVALLLVAAAVASALVACGGGKSDPNKNQGQAGLAAAEFFRNERDGGKLPEGPLVDFAGSQQIKALAVSSDQKKDNITARYCVQYRYSLKNPPFTVVNRVYLSTLRGGTWSVEAVKPNGNCDDVE
jgi:hypothetical protein